MKRMLLVLGAAGLLLAPLACSDDPGEPGTSTCGAIVFDDVTPTDENGMVVGAGGEGDWCYPDLGSDPSEPYLYPAYPNPFNPGTTIHFTLPEPAHVRLLIVSSECRVVQTLLDEFMPVAGDFQVAWLGTDDDGVRQPDGIYACILTVGDFTCYGCLELKSTP